MPEEAPGDVIVEFLIQGVTLDGKPFRPSDWAERLCGVMSAFGGDHRMAYSPFVHPVTAAGVRRLGFHQRRRGGLLVARGDRLLHVLDRAARGRVQAYVVAAALDRLAGALAGRFDVCH